MDNETRIAIRTQIIRLGLIAIRYQSTVGVLNSEIEKEFIAIDENTSAKVLADIKGKIKKAETLAAVSEEIRGVYELLFNLTADWYANGDS